MVAFILMFAHRKVVKMESSSNTSGAFAIDPGFDFLPKIDGLSPEKQKEINSIAFGGMMIPIIIRQVQEGVDELEAEVADDG